MVLIRTGNPGDTPGIARVHVDTWKYSYRGLINKEFLERISYEKAVQAWEKTFAQKNPESFIFVASDPVKGIVGFISGGLPRDKAFNYQGEIYAIYVLPYWQGRGIGGRLLSQALKYFRERGKNSFYLWTLASSKSRRFYETCNGKWKHQKVESFGREEYELAGYVWEIND